MLRLEAGHWEGDIVRGKTPIHCLLTLVERKNLYTRLSGHLFKRTEGIAQAVQAALRHLPALSLTQDNGTEFATYKAM